MAGNRGILSFILKDVNRIVEHCTNSEYSEDTNECEKAEHFTQVILGANLFKGAMRRLNEGKLKSLSTLEKALKEVEVIFNLIM